MISKTLLTLIFLSIGYTQLLACDKRVDPKKVVLFIDTNVSYKEVKAAKEAACIRGETFVTIPNDYTSIKKAGKFKLEQVYYQTLRTNRKCPYYDHDSDDKKCKELNAKMNQAKAKYDKEKYSLKRMNPSSLQSSLNAFAKKGISLTSIISSGHNGGGHIRGDIGQIRKDQILSALYKAYEDKPDLLNDLQMVCMWGCYTSVPSEVLAWKESLPNLKIMAGFHGSGPANSKEASHTLLKDLLIKEKSIVRQSNKSSLKRMISGIENINSTLVGLYAHTQCSSDSYYTIKKEYQGYDKKSTYERNFDDFEKSIDCNNRDIENLLRKTREEFSMYFSGAKEIPQDTQNSDLRRIYQTARSLKHCISEHSSINPDKVGLTLFYKGVKGNFIKNFDDDLSRGFNSFNKLETIIDNEIKKALNKAEDDQGIIKMVKNYFNDEEASSPELEELKSLKAEYRQVKEFLKRNRSKRIDQYDRSEIANLLTRTDSFSNHKSFLSNPSIAKQAKHFKKARDLIDNYLYQVNQDCMDFLEWHETVDGETPEAKCN